MQRITEGSVIFKYNTFYYHFSIHWYRLLHLLTRIKLGVFYEST